MSHADLPDRPLTRRRLLGTAGGAAAASALVAGDAARGQTRGARSLGEDTVEVIGRLDQAGVTITGYGYVTHLAGIADRALFTGTDRTEGTARVTFAARVTVVSRHQLDTLFTAVGTGTVGLYLNTSGGATFDDPATFSRGTRVATFTARLHNVLAVQGPDHALTTIVGELAQRTAPAFRLGGRSRRLGRRGALHGLEASGNGTRTDAAVPRATFTVGGRIDLAD